jgi:glycosyltransferase involved in cell wall biosynthesis
MEDKKILLVSNYFPPEKGAASNRMWSLAEGLSRNGYEVHVVCPLPNYPQGVIFTGFKGSFYKKKKKGSIAIHRLWLWPSNSSNKFIRLLSMISFSLSLTFFFILKAVPKKVFIQYSPVFVGFTGVLWAWIFRKKIILNVSDLWPLAGLEMGLLNKGFYYSILEKMERFCYKKSHLIVGQSDEILKHIKSQGIQKPAFLYRNLPDFVPVSPQERHNIKSMKIVYAGLLGVAQGLFKICEQLQLPATIELHIYGAGPEAPLLSVLSKKNIFFHGEIERDHLHKKLLDYDIAFIPLINRIYGSVPSKIFEYTRLGLPVLYYAGGEGGYLVKQHKLGWIVPVNNGEALQKFIDTISVEKLMEFPKSSIQQIAISAFNFENQLERFLRKVTKL